MQPVELLKSTISGKLDFEGAYELALALREMDDVQIAAILSALETRGYDSEIIAGFAKAMRDSAVYFGEFNNIADTCGTGGDGMKTINVSTGAAIALSAFHPVAKHGNRALTSSSGSADVLERLRIEVEMSTEKAREMLKATNFTFLFAPLYHASFARVGSVRKRLGIRTIFNVTGPLSNPAKPEYQMVGVSDGKLLEIVAEAMEILNISGVVLYGGMDEVNPDGKTVVLEVRKGVEKFIVEPEDFGVEKLPVIPCRDARESAERIEAVFKNRGRKEDRNFVALNFAMALYATGRDDLKEGVEIFDDALERGIFSMKLEEIRWRSTNTSSR